MVPTVLQVDGHALRSFLRVSFPFFFSISFPNASLFLVDLLIWNEIVSLGTVETQEVAPPERSCLRERPSSPSEGGGVPPGRGLSPGLIYLGRARHPALRDSNPARSQPPIGQGAGAWRPNWKGVWEASCAPLLDEPRGPDEDPRLPRIRLYARKLKLILLSFHQAPGCSSDVSGRKRIHTISDFKA